MPFGNIVKAALNPNTTNQLFKKKALTEHLQGLTLQTLLIEIFLSKISLGF